MKFQEKAASARNTRQLEISQEEMKEHPQLSVIDAALKAITIRTSPEIIDDLLQVLMKHVDLATQGEDG